MLKVLTRIATACVLGLIIVPGSVLAGDDTGLSGPKIDASRVNPQPLYPNDAQFRGEQGSVEIAVYVSSTGRPTGKLKLIKSSGYADLDNSAVEAVLGWHYLPATGKDGATQSSWLPVHIEFKLPPPPAQPAPAPKSPA